MDIKQIAADVAVSGQIDASDVAALAKSGYKSIICNRPEGESAEQTSSDDILAAAAAAGLEFRFIPVSAMTGITPENLQGTIDALEELPRPILAYCRSGARSANLYQAAVMRGARP
ncbi:MAG: TIGR01244 family sulfur transferase [Rhizobiaceae bacterium]|nr:TIGR01244 family sulfur transferase [Rhizobiaceae bacterium]